jgi:RNA polymerase sigma factor (sigma-70 family)
MQTKMTFEQEQKIATRIESLEQIALSNIQLIPEVQYILNEVPIRPEKTKAGCLERLEKALDEGKKLAKRQHQYRNYIRSAESSLREVERLRWNLAMSAKHVARGEARKLVCTLMDEEDLMQEGCIGLLRAAKRFDASRGIRFSTYARWWVRAQMTRAIETTGRMVRLPGGAVEQIRNLRRAAEKLDQAGIEYDISDLAAEVGIETKRARTLLRQGGVVSLDQQDPDGLSMGDRMQSNDEAPDMEAYYREALEILQDKFDDMLDDREKYIINHHYGLNGQDPRTMADIGKSLSLSRERVRQIEVGAFLRLRNLF